MRILYLGVKTGTCIQRAEALKRIGHEVIHVDPAKYVPTERWTKKFHWETGGLLIHKKVGEKTLAEIHSVSPNPKFDVAWVDGGRYVGGPLIEQLKTISGRVVNYNIDDPFGGRDRYSWSTYLRYLKHYDLLAVVRKVNVEEAFKRGAKDVIFRHMTCDEVAHAPRALTAEDYQKRGTDVLFVGTWMEDRGTFMNQLISLGVPLSIYGSRWERAKEWSQLKPYWKGTHLGDPDTYCKTLQCSKVSIGILSKGNRDMHTTRSSEIPALGVLLCAERTAEHSEMYDEGSEAVFWKDATECAKVCHDLLANDERRKDIAARGRLRVLKNQTYNEPAVAAILDRLFKK